LPSDAFVYNSATMKTYTKPLILALILICIAGYMAWRQFTPSGYVFMPYESTILREGKTPEGAQAQKLETELAQFQNSLGAFTKPEDMDKKLNTLTLISEYQQMLGRYGEAKKALETALGLKVNSRLLQSYAQLLFTMGARENAVPYVDAAIMFAPETPELWRLKLDMLSEINKNDLTVMGPVYREAIEATNNLDMVTMYAAYLGRQGKKDEAIQYWQRAQQISPKQRAAYQQEIDALK